jgi:hypothetical protein
MKADLRQNQISGLTARSRVQAIRPPCPATIHRSREETRVFAWRSRRPPFTMARPREPVLTLAAVFPTATSALHDGFFSFSLLAEPLRSAQQQTRATRRERLKATAVVGADRAHAISF